MPISQLSNKKLSYILTNLHNNRRNDKKRNINFMLMHGLKRSKYCNEIWIELVKLKINARKLKCYVRYVSVTFTWYCNKEYIIVVILLIYSNNKIHCQILYCNQCLMSCFNCLFINYKHLANLIVCVPILSLSNSLWNNNE